MKTMVKTSNGHGLIFLVMLSLILFIGSVSYVFATERPKQSQINNYNSVKSSTTVKTSSTSSSFSYAKGGNSASNSSATGGTAVVSGVQGGAATSSSGGNSLTVNNPQQWPTGFATGYPAASPSSCMVGIGLNGGYGGVSFPWSDRDCKIVVAAQMELSRGNLWGYCRLMSKTDAFEIAEITFTDCRANHEPTSQIRPNLAFPTPASDKLKELYPEVGR